MPQVTIQDGTPTFEITFEDVSNPSTSVIDDSGNITVNVTPTESSISVALSQVVTNYEVALDTSTDISVTFTEPTPYEVTVTSSNDFEVTFAEAFMAINGLPSGGSTGDFLLKYSGTNYDAVWTTISATTPLSYSLGVFSIQPATTAQSGYLTSNDWNTFNNKISFTSLSATSPITYSSSTGVIALPSIPIGLLVSSSSANSVLYLDSNNLLANNSRFTWINSDLRFSTDGGLREETNEVYFYRSDVDNYICLNSDGDITLHSLSGSIPVSELVSDLAQIVGPTIQDAGAATVIDYTSTLKFYYASSDMAWDVEGGQIWWPGGSGVFLDMVFGYMSDQVGTPFMDIAQRLFSDEIGGNAIEFTSGGIGMYNLVSRYNGTLTAGQGMASIYYEYKTTGSTAALNNNYTTAAAAGQYRISVTLVVTGAWTAGTISSTLAWNNGTAKTKVLFTGLSLTTIGNEDQYIGCFDVSTSTTINIITTLAGTTGSGTYRFKSIVERIG